MANKKVLFITYYAPPVAASGTFRTVGFIRNLSQIGWDVEVLTVLPDGRHQVNRELLKKIPAGVSVHQVRDVDLFSFVERSRKSPAVSAQPSAEGDGTNLMKTRSGIWRSLLHRVKESVSSFLKTPDFQIGWYVPALFRCIFSLKKPAVLYSSAPPYTGHLIGLACRFFWRVPLVCDFRDPWLDNPFRFERTGWVGRWDAWLEKQVFSRADLLIANTAKSAALFRSRFPRSAHKVEVIANGFDPEDYDSLVPKRDYPEDVCVLMHTGFLYGERDPTNFLRAVQMLVEEKSCPHLRIALVGSASVLDQNGDDLISRMGLESVVACLPPVPHDVALSLMKGADALLLLAVGTVLQIPAKLYEYLGVAKPILSVAEPASATAELTETLSGLAYCASNDTLKIKDALLRLYADWQADPHFQRGANLGASVEAILASLTRRQQARVLSDSFERLVSGKR
ncbi:MAG: glycosyltransferase [Desulfobulbus sp.]|jgi:glycosyltransferase involved in cell wall biosynthesis